MTDVKHTPAPWWVEEDDFGTSIVAVDEDGFGDRIIVDCFGTYIDDGNLLADAHLIASAPTLREALESAPIIGGFESAKDFKKRQDAWLRETLDPAIALAKGEKVDG